VIMFAINIKGKLQKEYNVDMDRQIGTGGLGLRWKLYDGVDKKTKEEVTIFVFSKKDLPKPMRKDNDRFMNLLKKEVERGYKFKHPHCLRVVKPMMEIRGEMAFVAERIRCSLSDILGDSAGDGIPSEHAVFKFGALQLRAGLAQLCDAALFMHKEAHMAHGFISPSTVYVTQRGDWKLFGFQFAEHLATEHDEAHLGWDFTNIKEVPYYPPMECTAPELMVSNVMTRKSDVFSIARLSYILHRQQAGIRRESPIESADQFRRFINDLSVRQQAIPWQGVPESLVPALKRALICDEKTRCKVEDIVNCQYLNDLMVRVIRYLDKLLDKDRDGKIKFLKKLPEVISQFDSATLVHKALPPLMLQLQDESMVLDVLPSLMAITKEIGSSDYQRLIEPVLRRYFDATDLAQVFYILVENVVLLCSKSSVEGRREGIVPMVVKALSVRNVAIQSKALQQIPEMVNGGHLEWKELKNKVLPKMQAICALSVPAGQNSVILPLRVNVLLCFSKIFEKLESETITNVVVTECIGGILSKTRESAVLMSVLGVLDAVAKHCSPRVVAQHILPKVGPLLIEPELNRKQYSMFVESVRYMVNKIDRYRVDQFVNPQRDGTSRPSPGKMDSNSMAEILESHFDPRQSGERHQTDDDPFASAMKSPQVSNSFGAVTASAAVDDEEDDDDEDEEDEEEEEVVSDPFGASSVSPHHQKRNDQPSSSGFVGFESGSPLNLQNASSLGSNPISNDNAFNSLPSFYGTASTADQTVSSSNSSKPQQSAAPKRKVRSKGSIKKKAASRSSGLTVKPMSSGYTGFGSTSSNGSSSGGSAFGFMNTTTSNQNAAVSAPSTSNMAMFGNGSSLKAANDDMFGGMKLNEAPNANMNSNRGLNADPFASLGNQYGSGLNANNQPAMGLQPAPQQQEKSSFDFMNQETAQQQSSMFQGFGSSPTMATNTTSMMSNNSNSMQSQNNNRPSDDPFAGLF